MRPIYSFIPILAIGLSVAACTSTTEQGEIGVNRRQMMLVPSSQIEASSVQAYEQTKGDARAKGQLDRNADELNRVQSVTKRLIPMTRFFRKDAPSWAWEVHVISSPEVNAYCMPGGKIIVYSGIIEKLNMTDGEIAAVLGHEISHALREHGRERMSEELVKQIGLEILVGTGKLDAQYAPAANAVFTGLVSLPHSRGQESEADEIGTELMARAGYDPHEALSLWKKMSAQGGSKPPQFLSTHPADETRLNDITALLPKVMPLYRATQSH